MATDKRKFLRFELPVSVKLTTTNGEELILKSQDISDSGLFLRGDVSQLPSVGENITVQLASMVEGDEPREINALVVRHNNDGIGVEFVFDESE
jgi:c-di-GMP-binding flagellar brake protein YcgR